MQEKTVDYVDYYLLAEELEYLGESYGIQIECANGEADCVRGITFSQCEIMGLLFTMMKHSVTPVTLRDVIEDWLLQ